MSVSFLIIFTSLTHPLAPAAMPGPATRGQPYLCCEAGGSSAGGGRAGAPGKGVKVQHFSATGDEESLLESDVTDTSSVAIATSLTYLMRSLPRSRGEGGGRGGGGGDASPAPVEEEE